MRDLPFAFRGKYLSRQRHFYHLKVIFFEIERYTVPQKAFFSKYKRQIPHTKITKFLPLDFRGNLCNSVYGKSLDKTFWAKIRLDQWHFCSSFRDREENVSFFCFQLFSFQSLYLCSRQMLENIVKLARKMVS